MESMMAASVGLWALALISGFLGFPTGKLTAPRDSASEAVKWVLPYANIVLHVNVEWAIAGAMTLMDEIAKQKLISGSKELSQGLSQLKSELDAGLQGPAAELGLNLSKDVGNVTFSMTMADSSQFKILLRARGNFGGSKLKEQVAKEAASTETLGKYTVYRMPDDSSTRDNIVVFVNDTTVVLGDRTFVENALTGKAAKFGADSVNERLSRLVTGGIETFGYFALPEWTLSFLAFDPDLQGVMRLMQGTVYTAWAAGPNKGIGVIQGNNAEQAQRVYYLSKSAASALSILDPAVDVMTYGMLGIAPLAPGTPEKAEMLKLLSDEKTVLEFSSWFKKRFSGKAKVSKDDKTFKVTIELTNPGSVLGLALPFIAGAAAWDEMIRGGQAPMDLGVPADTAPPYPLYEVPPEEEVPYTPVEEPVE